MVIDNVILRLGTSVIMPLYPKSPFKYNDEIQSELKADLLKLFHPESNLDDNEANIRVESLCSWLCSTPGVTTYRVNTLVADAKDVVQHIREAISEYKRLSPSISTNPNFPELIIVSRWDDSVELDLEMRPREVIVDSACGAAVLRGSHIFAPGVKIGDLVSVYADLTGDCKKGLIKQYADPSKVFLGNGVLKMTREYLFGCKVQNISGVAVYMTDIVSRLPNISDSVFPKGWGLLQNLPSIICTRVLNPLPGETILDMCAAPGNKTTHISALMKGQGTIIALEKIKSKVERMRIQCDAFSVQNVKIFHFDSTKAVCELESKSLENGPPFNEDTFDRVLLDGPCSALGQRPQLYNPVTKAQLCSYVPLQRKLFAAAVRLLKPGGTLVYSTCTITVGENEGIVSWALKTYPCLELKSVRGTLQSLGLGEYGTPGFSIAGLSSEQTKHLCRFGPDGDTVGFFIACFVKRRKMD